MTKRAEIDLRKDIKKQYELQKQFIESMMCMTKRLHRKIKNTDILDEKERLELLEYLMEVPYFIMTRVDNYKNKGLEIELSFYAGEKNYGGIGIPTGNHLSSSKKL